MRISKNSANYITIIRILFFPLLAYYIVQNMQQRFLVLSVILYLTDILDGLVARIFHIESDFGRKLDTIADTIFFNTLILGVLIFFANFFLENILLLFLILTTKVSGYLFALLRMRRVPLLHLRIDQAWGYVLMIFILSAFFYEPQVFLLYVLMVHALLASLEYSLFCHLMTRPEHENLHSLYRLFKILRKEVEVTQNKLS